MVGRSAQAPELRSLNRRKGGWQGAESIREGIIQPEATAHFDPCSQRVGEGKEITIEADRIPLSLCPACLELMLARSSGIRRAIREQRRGMHRRGSERRAGLRAKAPADLERVAKMNQGNGRRVGPG